MNNKRKLLDVNEVCILLDKSHNVVRRDFRTGEFESAFKKKTIK